MIAFDTLGDGPPLLLVPGMTSRDVWDPVAGRLAEERRLIRVDYPGFGGSPQTDPPTPAAAAQAVIELLDRLGLERVAIAGHSLGGWVALEVAKRGRAQAVLALAPAGLWRHHSPRLTDLKLNLAMASSRAPRGLRSLALKSPPHRYLALRDQSARPLKVRPEWALALSDAAAGATTWRQLFRATRVERFTGGQAIDVPVTVIWGDRDRLARRRSSRITDELPAHARVETWPRCGHVMVWDAPERVVAACLALAD
jgi:pimeloyl-ACP methyl ester carboxylesterase